MKNPPYRLAASIVCSNFLDIKKDISQLKKGKIDYIHFDVMDGVFVPRFGLLPELLYSIRQTTDIPINVHMMIMEPEKYIDDFSNAGADILTFHVENQPHIYRIIQKIKKKGKKVGLAFNPATSFEVLDYIVKDIDLITLMAINPGILGQKMAPFIYDKITDLKNKLINYPDMIIEIDGGVTPTSAPKMIQAGANMLVCGTGTIFQPPTTIDTKINELRKVIQHETNL